MYKQYFLTFIAAVCLQVVSAQVTTNLVVRSTPTDKITNWENDNSIINYIVNSQNPDIFSAIIKAELKTSDGTVIATKDLARAQVYSIAPGNRIYYAKDVLPLDIMSFSGSYQRLIARTGKIPAGNYQLTVQLVSPQAYFAISQSQTKSFYIPDVQLPVLMKPYNNEKLKREVALSAIIFRWTPKVPVTSDVTSYHIQAFEVLESQQPMQALRSNQPFLDEIVKGQTQYIWRPQTIFSDDTTAKKFVWTIQTLDANNDPVLTPTSNGESRSEPFVFEVLPAMNSRENDK